MNSNLPNQCRFVQPGGKITPDLLDRLKIRGVVETKLFFDFTLNFDDLIKERILAWTDGPIRLIYHGDGYLKLLFFKFHGQGSGIVQYYRNSLMMSFGLEMPFRLGIFAKKIYFNGYLDCNEHVSNYLAYNNLSPPPARIALNGITSQMEKSLDYKNPCEWIVGYSPFGTVINRISICKQWASLLNKTFYLKEDLDTPCDPEDERGEIAIGYRLDNLERLRALKGDFKMWFYLLPTIKPGDERDIINIIDRPLKITFNKYN